VEVFDPASTPATGRELQLVLLMHHRQGLHRKHQTQTPWTLARERTIPTERPPLSGEVNANFLLIDGVAWSLRRIPTAVFSGFLDRA
jgi:hypothetical protein